MFAYFHDCHSAHEFDDIFGPLSAGRHVLSKDYVGLVPNLDLVLTLDLGLLRSSPSTIWKQSSLDFSTRRWLRSPTNTVQNSTEGLINACPFRSRILSSGCRGVLPIAIRALYTFKSFLQYFASRAGQTVCLCIDNYTTPLLALPETQRTEIAEALELSLFHTIGPCVIKGYIRKGFIVGEWDVPCEPDEWAASESRGPYMDTDHGLFHVCVDLTHFPLMQETFGFVDSEVRKMDEAVGLVPDVKAAGDISNYLNDPQYFARRFLYMGETEKRGVYGTHEVLETLANRSGRTRF